MSLKGKTIFMTGGSRGIGLAIALRAARDGANIAIAAKTAAPHRHLPGTIYTAAEEIERAGGKALPLVVDVRNDGAVFDAVEKTAASFGGIDICLNNASAISLTGTLETDMKRFDLMHQITARGTFLTSKACIPHLKRAANPHVLNMSPPLNLDTKWLGRHVAYTSAKLVMAMCTAGMAEEFRNDGIAFNSLWPRTGIATAAIEFAVSGKEGMRACRTVDIMSDAAYIVLNKKAREFTGNFLIDDIVLYEAGERDFDKYRVDPSHDLGGGDYMIPDTMPLPPGVSLKAVQR
ncbi:MAG: NAD(P)-dependent oxidoreductase [Alphaproteobacteria bacterium]|jgi:citronellol/citronellal dehydrogenase|nr:NAD(P)-dependent oxidoreductase [Alphaproteobacteria bacterium]